MNQIPEKSPNDKLDYRVIKLPNGLTALLISDPSRPKEDDCSSGDAVTALSSAEEFHLANEDLEPSEESEGSDEDSGNESEGCTPRAYKEKAKGGEKLAAASMTIGAGSFSDPADLQGLAHFLEHMVFMGSEKYEDENAFDSFIKRNGGSNNANTDCERTNFFFEIPPKHFKEALDIFAQFFIAPLLKKDSLDRELEAVDSEFDLSMPSDTCRKQQLFANFAKPGHPMRTFMWGNTKSLKLDPIAKGIDVHARMEEFRKKYYSAQCMTLAVQARETLDTLEEWVREIFSSVPNNGLPPPDFSKQIEPFATDSFHKLYKVVPVKSANTVVISWSLPPTLKEYKVKPLSYISWLVGHEGKGSILSYLRKRVWALKLYAGNTGSNYEENTTYSYFGVILQLTENGLDHIFEVITAVMQYIKMIQQEGPQERIFREIQNIEENDFRWIEENKAIDYVECLSENMQLYPPEHYITGDELLFEYDPKMIKKFTDLLVPENINLMVYSKKFEGECDQHEKWYQTPYSSQDIDPEWIQKWKNLGSNSELHLPEVNRFIATDFDLKEDTAEDLKNQFPVKIVDDQQSRIWYRKDDKFKVPKGYLYFNFLSPIVNTSAENGVLLDLFVNLLAQNLKEEGYDGEVAKISYITTYNDWGLVIKVYGFNHKLALFFELIVDYIARFEVSEELFDAVKKELRKIYYNNFIKPDNLCRDVRLKILQNRYWPAIDKRAVIDAQTRQHLYQFVQDFKSKLIIEGLVQGNLAKEEVIELDRMIRSKLGCSSIPYESIPENQVTKIPLGDQYCQVVNLNREDGISVVTNYYQFRPGCIKTSVLIELLVMIMEEPCFDYLRTKLQLGYIVYPAIRITFGIIGYTLTVHSQSDKFTCSEVDEKMEAFLLEFQQKLEQMSNEEYNTQVQALIKLKKCEDVDLKEEVDRNWGEIVGRFYVFDRLQQEIAYLEKLSIDELRSWFRDHNSPENVRKLGIQVLGCKRPKSKVPPGENTFPGSAKRPSLEIPKCNVDETNFDIEYGTEIDSSKRFIGDYRRFKEQLEYHPVTKIIK